MVPFVWSFSSLTWLRTDGGGAGFHLCLPKLAPSYRFIPSHIPAAAGLKSFCSRRRVLEVKETKWKHSACSPVMTVSDNNTIETQQRQRTHRRLVWETQPGGSLRVQIDFEPLPECHTDQSTRKAFVENQSTRVQQQSSLRFEWLDAHGESRGLWELIRLSYWLLGKVWEKPHNDSLTRSCFHHVRGLNLTLI